MVISPRKAATTRERDEGGGPRALTMFFLDPRTCSTWSFSAVSTDVPVRKDPHAAVTGWQAPQDSPSTCLPKSAFSSSAGQSRARTQPCMWLGRIAGRSPSARADSRNRAASASAGLKPADTATGSSDQPSEARRL